MRVALDLFCGTGGATAAFKEAGWHVIGVDNDPRRRPGVVADVRRLPIAAHVDFLWASPPCNEFSTMPPGRDDRRPSLEFVFAALTAVRDLRPRFWIIENVRGALPFLGVPRQKIGPFCLWGYFPRIKAPLEVVDYRKMTAANKSAADRAVIPPALSLAILQAVEKSWDKKSIVDLRPYRRHRYLAKINRTGPAWRPSRDGYAAAPIAVENLELNGQVDGHQAELPVPADGHAVGARSPADGHAVGDPRPRGHLTRVK